MFIETITAPRDEWELWTERVGGSNDPPQGLVVLIAWDSGAGQVTQVNVWENPGAVADFFMDRVKPIIDSEGEPANKPQRHGEPLAFFLRK